MSEWIPLLQSLVWPVFFAILLFVMRRQVRNLAASIARRVDRGDSFQVGPGGLSLGQGEPRLTKLDEVSAKTVPDRDTVESLTNVVYLIHSASAPRTDADGTERRELEVIVDADSASILDKVERVVYQLHPTFTDPVRQVTNRKSKFAMRTRAWGQFNLKADVYFKDQPMPLTLYRYLNF